MHHKHPLVTSFFALLAGATLHAQMPLDANVAAVVTGGRWTAGTREGKYRVIVRTSGYEHVASSIRLEWLVSPDTTGLDRVVAVDSMLPVPDRIYSFQAPVIVANYHGFNLSVCGTNTYDRSSGCWLIDLGPPGKVSKVKGPD